jgi:hypothetical protein
LAAFTNMVDKALKMRCCLLAAALALAGAVASTQAQTIITNTFTFTFATGGATSDFNSAWDYWYSSPGGDTPIQVDVTMDASNNPASGSLKVVSPLAGYTQDVFFGTFASNVNNRYDFSVRADLTLYSNISFDIRVAAGTPLSSSGNYGSIGAGIINASYAYQQFGSNVTIPATAASQWVHITVPIDQTQQNLSNVPGIAFDINSYGGYPLFTMTNWLDNISANAAPQQPAGTNATNFIGIDAGTNRNPISSLIYGTAFATSNQLADLNFTMNRSGGNEESTYNWEINAHGKGADYYFESYPDSSATAGESADSVVANSKAGGAQPLITIPIIGWSPILGPGRTILPSYAISKYGPQTGFDPYFTNAGNGVSVTNDTLITWNNPTDAYMAVTTNYQAAYVQHLTNTWGQSTNGGVGYYLMDNEHSLWFSTHQDIHPVGPTMQEVFGKIVAYASMVKSLDPQALVLGPEEWGWPGYFYSGYDQQWSGLNDNYNPADYPDRATNGGMDYMPWLLNQLRQYNLTNGARLLDYFTLHCYPQEGNVGSETDVSTATSLLRNQSTRQFWDASYVDPSWINSVIMLIPRMQSWVAAYYPGTKIGITEYNWGAEAYMSGATAQADILGIFGRQGLNLATRWTTPTTGTPTYLAMKMYRNYDSQGHTFGDTSVLAGGPNPDNVAVFAAQRSADEALTIMVVSKYLTGTTPLVINVTNFTGNGTAQVWQLNASNVIAQLPSLAYTNGALQTTVPGQSVTLLVLPPSSTLRMAAGGLLSNGQFQFFVGGEIGRSFILQSSADLLHWSAISTNTFAATNASFQFSSGPRPQFYRAALLH